MKKVNLVLFVLLASNVFVKPSRDWCANPGIEGTVALGVVVIVSGGTLAYLIGKDDGKIEAYTHNNNIHYINQNKTAWVNYEGDKKQDFEPKVNSLLEAYSNENTRNNAKECARIRSELDKIFDELGIKRSK